MDEIQIGPSTPHRDRTVRGYFALSAQTHWSKGRRNGGGGDESPVGEHGHRDRRMNKSYTSPSSPTPVGRSQPQGSLGKRSRPTSLSVSEPRKRQRPTPSAQLQKYMDLNKVTFTEEHDAIFQAAKTHDIILTAPFGVGKTTILEAIVAGTPDERTLILTRGQLQRQAIGFRLTESGCKPHVVTFSMFASWLFREKSASHSDRMADAMRLGLGSDWDGGGYKRVVVDEFQDCKREEYYMIYTALKALQRRHDVRLIFIGNECQSLFGGDSRYLEFANRAMGLFGTIRQQERRQWERFTLRQAGRTTSCDAAFINNVFLSDQKGRHLIGSHEPGHLPIYIYGYSDESLLKSIVDALTPLIIKFGLEGIAILMPSTRNLENKLSGKLLNTLKGQGYDVVQPDNSTPSDPNVFARKIAVANYHQFQGLERPVVVVLGLDESYFKYHCRNRPTDRCPDDVLLALTRAKRQLILVHCASHATMPFVRADRIKEYTDFRVVDVDKTELPCRGEPAPPCILPAEICVSDLARGIPSNTLQALIENHLTINVSPPLPPTEHIVPRDIVTTDREAGRCEAVGNVTSPIFIAAVEHSLNNTTWTLNAHAGDFPKLAPEQVSWLARAAIACYTERSGCVQREVALKNHPHDWITERDFRRGCDLLRKELVPNGTEHVQVRFDVQFARHQMSIKTRGGDAVVVLFGHADAVVESSTGDCVEGIVEGIKCVDSVTMADIVQAAECGYLYACERGLTALPTTILFNLLDGKKIQIEATVERVTAMNRKLLREKYKPPVIVGDMAFVRDCREIRAIVNNNFR